MPSPVAHLSMGLFLWFSLKPFLKNLVAVLPRGEMVLWMGFLFFSMFPDLDAVLGIITGDMGRYHNQGTHSLLVGITASLGMAYLGNRLFKGAGFRLWLLWILPAVMLHILMDTFCFGRGVKLAWPFSSDRVQAPMEIFGGLHWSEGLWSPSHIFTVIEELRFSLLLILVAWLIVHRKKNDSGLPSETS